MDILSQIIQILVGGITGIAQGVGSGLSNLAESVFLTTTGTGADATTTLSVFGTLVVVFAGISLAENPLASINDWKKLECFNTNQSGSVNFKRFSHAQRIEIENYFNRIKYLHEPIGLMLSA